MDVFQLLEKETRATEMNSALILAATKYALMRQNAFIEWQCVHWLHEHWHILAEETKTSIRRAVESAFADNYDDLQLSQWVDIRKIWIGE